MNIVNKWLVQLTRRGGEEAEHAHNMLKKKKHFIHFQSEKQNPAELEGKRQVWRRNIVNARVNDKLENELDTRYLNENCYKLFCCVCGRANVSREWKRASFGVK